MYKPLPKMIIAPPTDTNDRIFFYLLINTFVCLIIFFFNFILINNSCKSKFNRTHIRVNSSNNVPYVIKQYQCTALLLLSLSYFIEIILFHFKL